MNSTRAGQEGVESKSASIFTMAGSLLFGYSERERIIRAGAVMGQHLHYTRNAERPYVYAEDVQLKTERVP